MPGDVRRMVARTAFLLMVAGLFMAVLSVGAVLSFMMDSNVTDRTEEDFAPSGTGEHGRRFSIEMGADLPGAMALTITDDDDEGWAWVSIAEGGASLEDGTKATFPFTGQYPVEGRGSINITISLPEGIEIEDLEVDVSISGATGLFGAFSGIAIGAPCCAAWTGSLVLGIIGIYMTLTRGRTPEVRRWS
jgi:hypothetical protein